MAETRCPCSYDCAMTCATALLAWSARIGDDPVSFARFVGEAERGGSDD